MGIIINRLTVTFIAIFATFHVAFAKLYLEITPLNSDPVIFNVSDNLKVSVENDYFVFSDENHNTSIGIGDVKSFKYFETGTTEISDVLVTPTVSMEGSMIKIYGVSETERCRIISVSGRTVLNVIGSPVIEIPLSRLNPGAYILTLGSRVALKFYC